MRKLILYGFLFLFPLLTQGATFGGNILTDGVTTTCSSVVGSEICSYATDENNSTFWDSQFPMVNPEWVKYQLSDAAIVAKIGVRSYADANGTQLKSINIQGSNDGSSWNTITSVTSTNYTATTWEYFEFEEIATTSYTYYRLELNDSWYTWAGDEQVSLYDWEAYECTDCEYGTSTTTSSFEFMSTTTDALVGNFFHLLNYAAIIGIVLVVAWLVKKLVKG